MKPNKNPSVFYWYGEGDVPGVQPNFSEVRRYLENDTDLCQKCQEKTYLY